MADNNSIAVQILSGDLNAASEQIHEELAKLALEALSTEKQVLAKSLFVEDFDAAPKGKTEFDAAKEDEGDDEDEDADKEGPDEDDSESDNDNDDKKSEDDGDTEVDIKIKKDGKVEQN